MTKKDYKAIGQVLHNFIFFTGDVEGVIFSVAREMAYVFAEDNPRFNRDRFLRFVETGEDKA